MGALCGFQFDAAEGRMSGLCAADCVTRRWQLQWAAPVPAPQKYPNRTLALYCAEGDLTLSDAGVQAAAGELRFVKGQMRPSFIWKAKRGLQLWQQ